MGGSGGTHREQSSLKRDLVAEAALEASGLLPERSVLVAPTKERAHGE